MPATEEVIAAPSAATGDILAVTVPLNTSGSLTAPSGKKRNMVAKVNVPKNMKSHAKSQHNHPPYGNMIKAALMATQDKKGSSRAAILKYIMQNFAVGENPTMVNAHLRMGLKRGVASGILKQMKGTGASGSFRLADAKSESPKKIKKRAIEKSATAGDMKKSSKKSMKKKSSAKKMNSPKVSKPKAVPKKKANVAAAAAAAAGGASGPKSKKAAGRPKKAKASPVKSKMMKKSTVAHARNKKMAA